MKRHDLLRRLHELVRPRSYLEIGVADGASLTLSRVPSVAIDPSFNVVKEIHTSVQLNRCTSDEFFARTDPMSHLPGRTVDLAFIDGMHLSEFTLRDFINVERFTTPSSVILLDDMLPRSVDEAARARHTHAWTGDVYKVADALRKHRPDLVVLELDTKPTGTVLVLLPDASSTALASAYDELVEFMVTPDPQDVPPELIDRSRAIDPETLLTSKFWQQWPGLRDRTRRTTRRDVQELLECGGFRQLRR